MSWAVHNSWRNVTSKNRKGDLDNEFEDYDDDYDNENNDDYEIEQKQYEEKQQNSSSIKDKQSLNEGMFQPKLKTKKKKPKKKKTPVKKVEKEEILPNNVEIKIIETKNEVKTFLNFSPVHNSTLMSWASVRETKNLQRSYFPSVLIKDKKGNQKIYIHGGNDQVGNVTTQQLFDLTELQVRNVTIKGKELQTSRVGHTATLDYSGTKIFVVGGYTSSRGYMGSVDVLYNVDDSVDKWQWGDKHNPTLHPKERENSKEMDSCGCGYFDASYHINHKDQYYNYNHKEEIMQISFPKKEHYTTTICTNETNLANNKLIRDRQMSYDQLHKTIEIQFPTVAYHTTVQKGQNFYVFGGEIGPNKVSNGLIEIAQTYDKSLIEFPYERQLIPYKVNRAMSLWRRVKIKSDVIPPPRSHHGACIVNYTNMYIIGGRDGPIKYNDIYMFDFESTVWKKIEAGGTKLPPIYGHSVTSVGDKIFIFGGVSVNQQILNNIYIFDTKSNEIIQVNVGGNHPSPRAGASLQHIGEQLIVIGGCDEKEHKSDIFVLDNISKMDKIESSLGKEMALVLNDKKYSDITFNVNGKDIYAHKIVLSCRSSHFRELFSGEHPNPITFSNFEHEHFLLFLQYLYSDSIMLSSKNVSFVVELARAYECKQLELICKSMMEEIIIPSTSYNGDFKWAINNQSFSDISFIVEGVQYFAHKVFVCLRCPYFNSMLNSVFKEATAKEVKISDIDKETFQLLLEFIYTDNMTTNPQIVFNLLCQSELFGVCELKERAEQFLMEYVDEENSCLFFETSDRLKAEQLKKKCKAYILANYVQLFSTEEYKNLPQHLIEEINLTRENMNLGIGKFDINLMKQKKEEKINCTVCNQPLIYTKETWKAQHPRQLLESALKKKYKKINFQFVPVVTKNAFAFVSKLIVTLADKKKEYVDEQDFGANKKDSEAKILVHAYHKLICQDDK